MIKLFAIIRKDTLVRFTSPVEWLFFLILPVVFIFILSGGTGAPGDTRISLLTVDQAQSTLSAALIEELEKSPSVRPELTSLREAQSQFDSFQVSAVLIIPEGFTTEASRQGAALVELQQQQNNMNALVQQQAVSTAVGRLSSLVDIATTSVDRADSLRPFTSDQERVAFYDEAFGSAQRRMATAPQRVVVFEGETEDPINYDPRANSVAGQMITWVFIPLIGVSAMFAWEREGGTLRRLLVSPTSKAMFIGSTVVGQVLTALVQMAILIVFGALTLDINWGSSPLALGLIMLTSALSAAALGTMLGTMIKTAGQGDGLSILIGMVMAMMGGCWYPIELFPEVIRQAAQILPTYWAMNGFLNIAVRGQGLEGVLLPSAILTGFAIVFFSIGVWRFKFE